MCEKASVLRKRGFRVASSQISLLSTSRQVFFEWASIKRVDLLHSLPQVVGSRKEHKDHMPFLHTSVFPEKGLEPEFACCFLKPGQSSGSPFYHPLTGPFLRALWSSGLALAPLARQQMPSTKDKIAVSFPGVFPVLWLSSPPPFSNQIKFMFLF